MFFLDGNTLLLVRYDVNKSTIRRLQRDNNDLLLFYQIHPIRQLNFLYTLSLGRGEFEIYYPTFLVSLLVLTFIGTTDSAYAAPVPSPHEVDIPKGKPWTATFSRAVDRNTVTSSSIYGVNSKGAKQAMTVTYSDAETKVMMCLQIPNY